MFTLSNCVAILMIEAQIIDSISVYGVLDASCGSVINGSTKLSANLVCNDHGIIVNASDVSIALNGYSIIGPGSQSTKSGLIVPDLANIWSRAHCQLPIGHLCNRFGHVRYIFDLP